jgi:hypothetical protein
MDYQDVPKELLDLAVKVSKAANAEYWACDIAVGEDGKYRILECATAFAAFPYIRDWIGQYLMWKFSNGRFPLPNIPIYNWEELGKMDSSVLRTLRYITFGRYSPSYDGAYFLDKKKKYTKDGEVYLHKLDSQYPMLNTYKREEEEWPSEKWNFQDNYTKKGKKKSKNKKDSLEDSQTNSDKKIDLSTDDVKNLLQSVKGIGKKKSSKILEKFDIIEIIHAIETKSEKLIEEFSWFDKKILKKLNKEWEKLKERLDLN